MDPNAALAIALDQSASPEERSDAALALGDWIRAGGFLPETDLHASTLLRKLDRISFNGGE